MPLNIRRGIDRAFVVLIPIWIIYCLVVYPTQRQLQAAHDEKTEFKECWEQSNPPDMKGCMDYARAKARTDMWTLKAFYVRESWFLALVVTGIPLLAYGLCRVAAWVCAGFVSPL